jgi:hypothetical protein
MCAVCNPPTRTYPKGTSSESIDNLVLARINQARDIAATALRLQRDALRIETLIRLEPSKSGLFAGDERCLIVDELAKIIEALATPKVFP